MVQTRWCEGDEMHTEVQKTRKTRGDGMETVHKI